MLLLWLGATAIGMFLSLVVIEAAYLQGEYVPTGNDSFYHARRMLDVAAGMNVYQFDPRIGPPDGVWIPWPWVYDWLMGKSAAVVTWLSPSTSAFAFLACVPVAWLAVNAALFIVAAKHSGLQLGYIALAMLAFALAPFVQMMHMVGKVDHHFLEFTFVLLTTLSGLRFFANNNDRVAAIALGISLGIAPGFHIGLFVLQLPVLACAGILWLRGQQFSRSGMHQLAIALAVSGLLVAIPSDPFRAGMFEFGLLSGFHVYVAICSAIVLAFLAWKPFNMKSLGMLAGIAVVMMSPVLGQLLQGAAFVSRDVSFLENVIEATGPFELLGQFNAMWLAEQYSWLLFVVPLVMIYYIFVAAREAGPRDVFFAVMTVFGIAFMLMQFRFNNFGLFAMVVGSLLIAQRIVARFDWNQGIVAVVLLGVLLLAYQPPLRGKLFDVYALGAAPIYERARPVFLELADRCNENPGLIMADKHDGNYLLYHTDCSVLSNNFMQTAEDVERIAQFTELMKTTPRALRAQRPDIDYLLIRAWDYYEIRDGKIAVQQQYPLAAMLIPDGELPEGYELLQSIYVERNGEPLLYAKAFAIN